MSENYDNPQALGIELEHLTKVYPGQPAPAVADVSMDIPAGELVAFVGPSGCGKTTTMKLINRLIEPTSGAIRLGGEDVTHSDPVKLRRRIGYVIQSIGLFPHMTIADNVAAVPKMLGWPKKRIADRSEELLTLVGLEPAKYMSRYPRQLSGGQQQRVGVARALAADPPVLLMDEPFGATDPITRLRLQREFKDLQRSLGKTVIFVTHDFEEALLLGDRIAVLADQSRVVQYDRPLALLTNPADEHVRQFVGSTAHVRLLALLPAANAIDPAVATEKQDPVIAADATLREVTEQLLGGAQAVRIVDAEGNALGAADFASVRKAIATARLAETQATEMAHVGVEP
ncbi:osmoprotectant transport system ATP-binding protein [Catenulispora sp. GP43]|uniref:ABC transporter ATP-binding protein n=1 Tax=Catenulispora sp. GP43 TaxID=3156263 RepID=UPI003516AEE7